MSQQKLTKGSDRMIMGVCSGISDFLHIDQTVVRLAWVLVTALTGFFPGIIAYIIASVIIPEKVVSEK